MKDIFQIKLSAKELLVLSALLGYESVFGIRDDAFLASSLEIKSQIRQTVQQLERKKLIRYDLDGTLYIKPALRMCIECICCAQTVGCFSTNAGKGKNINVYVLEKDSHITTIENAGNGKYKLLLSDRFDAGTLIPEVFLNKPFVQLDEMMLLEEAQAAQAHIEAFDEESAKMRIQKHIHDQTSCEFLTRILSRKCDYLRFQIHRKDDQLYRSVCNGLYLCDGTQAVSLSADQYDVLHFRSADAQAMLEHIRPYFSFCIEEGVQ